MIWTHSEFLSLYLDRGLSDIVVIDYEHREERSGYQVEHTDETVIAKLGSTFVQMSVSDVFHPMKTREPPSISGKIISQAEYETSASDKPIIDTPEARAELQAKKTAERAKQQARQKLDESAPRCPSCAVKMTQRRNAKNGTPFWGCPRFPKCRATINFTDTQKRLLALSR